MARAVVGVLLLGAMGPPAGAGKPVLEDPPQPIFRLRIAVRTTARVARVRVKPPAILIQGDVRRARGELLARWGSLGRGPLEVVRRPGAPSAAATFVVALASSGTDRLRFVAGKEGGGVTTIRMENLNLPPAQRIGSVRHRSARRKPFALPLGSVAARGPVPGTDPLPPSVLAFYYPWYHPEDWAGGKPIAE